MAQPALSCVKPVSTDKAKLKKEEPPAPEPESTVEIKLLTEIRDLLKSG